METPSDPDNPFRVTIAPWLSVRNSAAAVEFYKQAFGADELYHLEDNGATFWLADESPEHANHSPETLGGGTVRMVLTVPDPDAVFACAIAAGATEV